MGEHHRNSFYNISRSLFERTDDKYREYAAHKKIKNNKIIVAVDYTVRSNEERLFIYDRDAGGCIGYYHCAHGRNSSQPNNRATASYFSNKIMSKCSSIGAVATGSVYYGKYGRSLNLHGLEKGVNDNMFIRRIVLHKSKYVAASYIDRVGYPGRSWGCLAVDPQYKDKIIDLIKDGVFIYLFGSK